MRKLAITSGLLWVAGILLTMLIPQDVQGLVRIIVVALAGTTFLILFGHWVDTFGGCIKAGKDYSEELNQTVKIHRNGQQLG